jgi:HSP20 family protein
MTWTQQWPQTVGFPDQAMSIATATQPMGGAAWQTPSPAGQEAASVQQQASQTQAQAQETAQQQGAPVVPAADVVESPTEIVVYVDTPGFEKEHLQIHADGNRIYLSGDRAEDATIDTDKGERPLVMERPLRVERTIPLPVQVDPEQVTATHDNGVCEIVVPKDETDRRHEIGFQ